MGKYISYSEKLKHPKWQKKRLQVFERDEFRCQLCWDNKSQLHVHHKYYNKNCDPWDYKLKAFITLCETCHKKLHPNKNKQNDVVIEYQNIERNTYTEKKDIDSALLQRERFFAKFNN